MGTRLDSRHDQTLEVIDRLHDAYPDTTISLNFSSRLELLIAVMLSAQCTDERVNKVTAELFDKYDGAEAYAAVDQEILAEDISSITYYNNKAKYIRSACSDIIEKHDNEVPDTMDELTDLMGVGRKTANVVLQHGHEIVEGIVVDTHVQRISRRLGITEEQREFLKMTAQRHIVFNYENIAEYYAHADPEMQELIEELTLVIVDFENAIEQGFVEISEEVLSRYDG